LSHGAAHATGCSFSQLAYALDNAAFWIQPSSYGAADYAKNYSIKLSLQMVSVKSPCAFCM